MKSRPTQKQIAEKLGLSAATVSLALRDNPVVAQSTRDLVQQAMRDTGYVRNLAAASLRTGRSNIVGVSFHTIAHNPFGDLLVAIERAFEASGTVILINNHEGDTDKLDRFVSTLATYGADALLVAPPVGTPLALMDRVGHHGMPILYLGHDVEEDTGSDRVGMDDKAAGIMAAQHLLDAGYESLCFVGGDPNAASTRGRVAGFREALKKSGVAWRDDFWVSCEPTAAAAYDAAKAVLQRDDAPKALVCHDDEGGTAALSVLRDLEMVAGADIGIVAIGSERRSRMTVPQLTMVCEDPEAMGRSGAETLLARLADPEATAQHVVLEPKLVIGGTSKR